MTNVKSVQEYFQKKISISCNEEKKTQIQKEGQIIVI